MKLLAYTVDAYKSATITDATLAPGAPLPDPLEFESRLFASLTEFKGKKIKGVWLRLPIEMSELVPAAVRAGFVFHSARADALTLTAWLPKESESKLPPAPYHFVGVGAFVLNSKDEILVVREKTGPSANLPNFFKLPGGLVDRAEDFHSASVRELKEETGIDADFVCLACIQEVHHSEKRGGLARGGMTDLYGVCVLRAKDEKQTIVPQEDEIAEAKWMPAAQVLAMPLYASDSVFGHMFRHAYDVARGLAPGFEVAKHAMGFVDAQNSLFRARYPAHMLPPSSPPSSSSSPSPSKL